MLNKKSIFFIGSITFIALTILSIIFYKERTCFIDIAFHLFYILKDNDFAIQNYRFGAFFTQLFPLLGAWFGASLKSITMTYSMSFVLLPFFTFLSILFWIKNNRIALSYLLFSIIMTTHTFYWIQSELPQAMAFFFIYLALLDNQLNNQKTNQKIYYTLSIFLITTIAFTHPLMLIPFSFILIMYWLSYHQKRKEIYISLSIFIGSYFVKSLFFKTKYDSQAMHGLINFKQLFPDYFSLDSNIHFVQYLIKDYYFVLLFLFIGLFFYFIKKDYLKLILLGGYFFAITLLINVTYPNGADQFYLENQYLLLAFVVIIPIVFELSNKIEKPYLQIGLLTLICSLGCVRIIIAAPTYTNRLNWNQQLLSKTENAAHKKLIISSKKVPKDILMMTWSTSYEIWLLSTIETNNSRSIIIEETENEFDNALSSNKSFFTKWGYFDYGDLNKKYFHFHDTTNYIKVE
ncbi:MAG TPA: hypothetical protein PKA54_05820 [Chitinophagaceae bacterium]|nr:hypothetical protein [Chitinophagaceae bacterium]